MINRLIEHASKLGCSDIHITAGEPPIVRVRGNLMRMPECHPYTAEEIRCIASDMLRVSVADPDPDQDALFGFVSPTGVRHRASLYHQGGECCISIRLLLPNPSIEALELPEILRGVANLKSGLVLVCGGAGDGRSTTIACILSHLASVRRSHIITLENPVEYMLDNQKCVVTQRELGLDFESYPQGIADAAKQDSNILMVNELDDPATLAAVLDATDTGKLVIASVRALSTEKALLALISKFPPERREFMLFQLAASLKAVFTQVLIPSTGNDSMVSAFEIMLATDETRQLISEGRIRELMSIIENGADRGMTTMTASLANLVQKGRISPEQAIYHSICKSDLSALLAAQR